VSNIDTVTDAEAAVRDYSLRQRVQEGQIIAVYDLGGGSFDAAAVRVLATGCELVGTPKGFENLGGIDFDTSILNYVAHSLGRARNLSTWMRHEFVAITECWPPSGPGG
jgi:molecular chaperone DnaK (HSP70)